MLWRGYLLFFTGKWHVGGAEAEEVGLQLESLIVQ